MHVDMELPLTVFENAFIKRLLAGAVLLNPTSKRNRQPITLDVLQTLLFEPLSSLDEANLNAC